MHPKTDSPVVSPFKKHRHSSKEPKGLMISGSIFKHILFFAIPLILGNFLQQLYNTADSIIVGNFVGPAALAAVGASTPVINLIIAFAQGASVGAGVVISQFLGANQRKEVQKAVHTALALALALGIILTITALILAKPILIWMDTPSDVFSNSVLYFQIFFAGILFNVLYNMASGILNAAGNSKRSLFYLTIASITNIILDLLFIGWFKMGIAGAAIATDISQVLSSLLAICFLMRTDTEIHVKLSQIRFHKDMLVRTIQVGLPTGIQNAVISFSNVLVQTCVNAYGAVAMAGFGAYLKIDGFNCLPVLSIAMAVTTFVGQNYGAGKIERIKKSIWISLAMGIGYTIFSSIFIFICSRELIAMFSSDPHVIEYGKLAANYFVPFYWIMAIMNILGGVVRGTGKSVPPMLIMLFSLCVFRIFWIWLVLPHFNGIEGIYINYPISWLIGAILMMLYAWKGKWLVYRSSKFQKA